MPSAVGAAEELSRHFDAMADHAALAVLADGCHSVDGALEAVEGVPRAGGFDVESLIVVIPADFALWHMSPSLHWRFSAAERRRE